MTIMKISVLFVLEDMLLFLIVIICLANNGMYDPFSTY